MRDAWGCWNETPQQFRHSLELAGLSIALSKDEYYIVEHSGACYPLVDYTEPAEEINPFLAPIADSIAGPNVTLDRIKSAETIVGHALHHFQYDVPPPPAGIDLDQCEVRLTVLSADLDMEKSRWFCRAMDNMRDMDLKAHGKTQTYTAHEKLIAGPSGLNLSHYDVMAEAAKRYGPPRDPIIRHARDIDTTWPPLAEPAMTQTPPPGHDRGSLPALLERAEQQLIALHKGRNEYKPGSHIPPISEKYIDRER